MGSPVRKVCEALLAGGALADVLDEELPHPDLEWARSGAMALAGESDGPPLLAPAPLATAAAYPRGGGGGRHHPLAIRRFGKGV